MARLLRPGTRLMRRLGVSGKFGLIAILLLLPLVTSIATAYQESSAAIAVTSRERAGLTCVRPLVRMAIELADTRSRALNDQGPDKAWVDIVREIDVAVTQHGDELEITTDWRNLRQAIERLYLDPRSPEQMALEAERTARQTQQMIRAAADSSALTVDPELDGYYLVRIMSDHIPRLVTAAAEAQEIRAADASPGGSELAVSAAGFSEVSRQIGYDLATATTSTSWNGLRNEVSSDDWALARASNAYASILERAQNDGDAAVEPAQPAGDAAPPVNQAEMSALATVFTNADSLNSSIARALDQLLIQRSDDLMLDRARPLLLTLIALLIVFYLMVALFRAMTSDVRTVLHDISTVTNGAVHQTSPLDGSDEFSQMSHAVIYARDRLTALVGTLKYQATHDELTALANRSLFTEKVQEALGTPQVVRPTGAGPAPSGAGRVGNRAAVLMIDLDDFKSINDSFGHEIGDRLLRTVGARIHRAVPRRSVVARLGGDEFAVLVTDARNLGNPQELVSGLQEALNQPTNVDGRMLSVQAGIGWAVAEPDESITALDLIRNADVALRYAKDRGQGHNVAFEPMMHEQTKDRTELSASLVGAVERGEMRVAYQPIVDLQTSTLHGVEALARWDHPTRGEVAPSDFIPLAEKTGQITQMGRWVLEQACEQLAEWQRRFPDAYPLIMEVNLAPEQLANRDLVPTVVGILQRTGIDPSALVLEVTESALLRDVETVLDRLGQLSAIGVRIALDDFGTGYSSLSYLRRLPATVLKIDRSFVIDQTDEGQALMRGIADLGTGQGMQIVAEGIENLKHAQQVRNAGCHLGQGFFWARGCPAEAIDEIISRGGVMAPTEPTPTTAIPGQRRQNVSGLLGER